MSIVDGLKTVYSADRTLRASWDSNTVYVMKAVPSSYYFEKEEIRLRYDLPDYPYAANSSEWAAPLAVEGDSLDDAWLDTAAVDSVTIYQEVESEGSEGWSVETERYEDNDWRLVDSVLDSEMYRDDYYLEGQDYYKERDSLVNQLIAGWLDEKVSRQISGAMKPFVLTRKKSKRIDKNTLMEFSIDQVNQLYGTLMAPLAMMYVLGATDIPTIDYGIKRISGRFLVDGNKMSMETDATLDKEMARYYKEIYQNKVNSKFAKYVDKEALGYMSIAVNTEAYIRNLTKIIDKSYARNEALYSDFIGLGAEFFDLIVDEKAIGKVIKGDNVWVLNGLIPKEVTYTDYEYDDNYDYIAVEKTKTETIPQFLGMFSSDDTSFIKRLLAVGVKHKVVHYENGLYALIDSKPNLISPHILLKDGIVFVGNDAEQLRAIQEGTFTANGTATYKKQMRKHNFYMTINTDKIPAYLQDLNFPMSHDLNKIIDGLKDYGAFYIAVPTMKGQTVRAEVGINFPPHEQNALQFVYKLIDGLSQEAAF